MEVRECRIAHGARLGPGRRLPPGVGNPSRAAEAPQTSSSAFYPTGIELATDELAAEVSGELVTWLGREEATRSRKRYRLVFAMEGGRIRAVAVRGTGGRSVSSGDRQICRRKDSGRRDSGRVPFTPYLCGRWHERVGAADSGGVRPRGNWSRRFPIAMSTASRSTATESPRVYPIAPAVSRWNTDPRAGRPVPLSGRSRGVSRPAPANLPAPAGAPAPVTLYLGTEQGFTYRLSLSVVSRDSAQILIRKRGGPGRGGVDQVAVPLAADFHEPLVTPRRRQRAFSGGCSGWPGGL